MSRLRNAEATSPPRHALVAMIPWKLAQHFLVDARLVIKPFAIRDRRELEQVLVPSRFSASSSR
jgi:hypothetical protein